MYYLFQISLVLLHGTLALKNNSYSKKTSQCTYFINITNTTSHSLMSSSFYGGTQTGNHICITKTPVHFNTIYNIHWQKIYTSNVNHQTNYGTTSPTS